MRFVLEGVNRMDDQLIAATVERMIEGSVVVYSVDEAELRNGDWTVPAKIIAEVSQRPELPRAAGSFLLTFGGLDRDARSVPEIPECQAWLIGLEKEAPILFFLLEPQQSLPLLTYCNVPFRKKNGQLVLHPEKAMTFYLNCAATCYEIGKTYGAPDPRLTAADFLNRIGMGGVVNEDLLNDFARANGD